MNQAAHEIEEWFAAQGEESEFVRYGRSRSYAVLGPRTSRAGIIYTTKPAPVADAIHAAANLADWGMIGRYGLPDQTDADCIQKLAADRRVLFLGDLDSVDLLVYAWLTESMKPGQVRHIGVNDRLIDGLKIAIPESFQLECSPAERRGLTLLERLLPAYRDTVGPICADVLHRGRKIEIEAVVSRLGSTARLLSSIFADGAS